MNIIGAIGDERDKGNDDVKKKCVEMSMKIKKSHDKISDILIEKLEAQKIKNGINDKKTGYRPLTGENVYENYGTQAMDIKNWNTNNGTQRINQILFSLNNI